MKSLPLKNLRPLKIISMIACLVAISACNPLAENSTTSSVDPSFHPGLNPSVVDSLSQVPSALKGGSSLDILFTQTPITISGTLEYSNDGGTSYTLLTAIIPIDTHYTWAVPTSETVMGILRLTLLDSKNVSTVLMSPSFIIDSTAPAAPSLTLTSANPARTTSITSTTASCADTVAILLSHSATTPSLSASGWINCSTAAGAITGSLNSGDGAQTIYAFARDLAGNISIASSFSVTLDQTPPSAPAITFSVNSLTSAAISNLNPTFTVSSCTGLDKILVTESTSTPTSSTSGWQTCTTTAGGISASLTGTTQGSRSLKAWSEDAAGNVSSATSLSFVYDSTAPTVSAFTVASGATSVSGVSASLSFTASDSLSGIDQYCLDTSAGMGSAVCDTTAPTLFSLPFSTGTYTVYLRVTDKAGNETTVHSQAIDLVLGTPPTLNILSPTQGTFSVAGAPITIQWKTVLTSSASLKAGGFKIEYLTTSNSTPQTWPVVGSYPAGTNLQPTTNGGCTLIAGATGCVTLGMPSALIASQFKIVIHAEDTSGNIAVATSALVLNGTAGLSLFAGADAGALGGTALATSLSHINGIARNPHNGDVFLLRDSDLLKISGATSVITRFIGPVGSQATIEYNFTGGSTNLNHTIDSDDAGNLYFATSDGIAKLTQSTQTVGLVTGSPADFNNLEVVNNHLYYSVQFNGFGDNLPRHQIYRLDAGVSTLVAGQDYSLPEVTDSDGIQATHSSLLAWTIERVSATEEKIWFATGPVTNYDIYSTNSDGTIHREIAGVGALIIRFTRYIPSRHSIGFWDANYGGQIELIDTLHPAVARVGIDQYNGRPIDVVDAGAGGLLFSGIYQQVVSYVNAANVRSDFAGIAPDAGENGLATFAQLRAPSKLGWDSAGNAYVIDTENFEVRKVGLDGKINRVSAFDNIHIVYPSTGTPLASPFFSSHYEFAGAQDLTGTCHYYCFDRNSASVSHPFIGNIVTGTDPYHYANGIPDRSQWGMQISVDGADTYVFLEVAGSAFQSYIHKIDTSGNVTLVAGDQITITADENDLHKTAGQTLLGHAAGSLENARGAGFQVANGVFYTKESNSNGIFSGVTGGAWVAQAPGATSFTLTPSTNMIYYFVGPALYRQPYVADGSGTPSLVADFTGILNDPILLPYNPNAGFEHQLYINDGNSIFKYVNAGAIP